MVSKNRPKSFRLSEETVRQLQELAGRWGESEAATVTRCIDRVYNLEVVNRVEVTGFDGGIKIVYPETEGQG